MVYKNLFTRIFSSLVILIIYILSLYSSLSLLIFGIIIYLFIIYEILNFFVKNLPLILIYYFLSIISFFLLINFYYNFYLFNYLILIIVLFDSFSFVSGSYFGKNYPFKKLSPKKTIEGYIGGILITNVIMFIVYSFNLLNIYDFLLMNIIIISAIFGDLIQSYFKRINNIKHSSNLLPGHGGFFDRFDSFMSSIIVLLFYSYIF